MRCTRLYSLLPATVVLVLLAPSSGSCQEGAHRGGFWLNAGLGGGFDQEMRGGRAGYLRVGGTLSPHFLLGVQGILFDARVNRTDWKTRTNLTTSLLAYPSKQGGFFLKVGFGYATDEFTRPVPQTGSNRWETERLLGANLGVGHELQLGEGNLYLTPNIDVMLGLFDDGIDNPDASFLFTVGAGFR